VTSKVLWIPVQQLREDDLVELDLSNNGVSVGGGRLLVLLLPSCSKLVRVACVPGAPPHARTHAHTQKHSLKCAMAQPGTLPSAWILCGLCVLCCHQTLTRCVSLMCSVNGYALPIDELKGTKPVESIDLSGKKSTIGVASGIIIAACIKENAVLKELNLAGNALCGVHEIGGTVIGAHTDEAINALCDAFKITTTLTSLNLVGNALGVEGCKAVMDVLDKTQITLWASHPKDGYTALMMTCEDGHEPCVRALVESGAAVDVQMEDGATALMFASQGGHEPCLRALVESGAAVDVQMEDGATALILASQNGHEPCVHALVESGAAVNKQRKDGMTALMMACEDDHETCTRLLLGTMELPDDNCVISSFGTVSLPGATLQGKVYYEITIALFGGSPQIGWATSGFAPGNGNGVGDDAASWRGAPTACVGTCGTTARRTGQSGGRMATPSAVRQISSWASCGLGATACGVWPSRAAARNGRLASTLRSREPA